MKTRMYMFLSLATFWTFGGCVTLKTPDGYAEREYTGGHDYKAISTDASVIAVTVYDNEDDEKGDLAYWIQAAKKHMILSRGYAFEEEGEFPSSKGAGKWMRFAKNYKGVEFTYLLGLVVDGGDIYALEATGEKALFDPDVPKVLKAFATLD